MRAAVVVFIRLIQVIGGGGVIKTMVDAFTRQALTI